MITRIYTSFMTPMDGTDPEDNRGKYWIDVQEDYDTVLEKVFPLAPAMSSLEARTNTMYTKISGERICCHPHQILGFEEITLD